MCVHVRKGLKWYLCRVTLKKVYLEDFSYRLPLQGFWVLVCLKINHIALTVILNCENLAKKSILFRIHRYFHYIQKMLQIYYRMTFVTCCHNQCLVAWWNRFFPSFRWCKKRGLFASFFKYNKVLFQSFHLKCFHFWQGYFDTLCKSFRKTSFAMSHSCI